MKNKKRIIIYSLIGSMAFTSGFAYKEPIKKEIEISYNEEDEFTYFEDEKELIEKYINEKNIEKAKETAKDFFITSVDFIFYDKEINGFKWKDLSDAAKEDAYSTFCEMDLLIMDFYPDYKENIDDKYQVVKKYVNSKYYKALDVIKEEIGTENYDSIKEAKEAVKDITKKETNKVKTKIKNWYSDFKNNK